MFGLAALFPAGPQNRRLTQLHSFPEGRFRSSMAYAWGSPRVLDGPNIRQGPPSEPQTTSRLGKLPSPIVEGLAVNP